MYTLNDQLKAKRDWTVVSNTKLSYMDNMYEVTAYSDGELIIYNDSNNNSIHFTPKNVDKLRDIIDKLQNKTPKVKMRSTDTIQSSITVTSLPTESVYIPSLESTKQGRNKSYPFPDTLAVVPQKVVEATVEVSPEDALDVDGEDISIDVTKAVLNDVPIEITQVFTEPPVPSTEVVKELPVKKETAKKASVKSKSPKKATKKPAKEPVTKAMPTKKPAAKKPTMDKVAVDKVAVGKVVPTTKSKAVKVLKVEAPKETPKVEAPKAAPSALDVEKNTKGIMREVKGWGVNVMLKGKKLRYYYDTRAAARLADPKHDIGSNGRTS